MFLQLFRAAVTVRTSSLVTVNNLCVASHPPCLLFRAAATVRTSSLVTVGNLCLALHPPCLLFCVAVTVPTSSLVTVGNLCLASHPPGLVQLAANLTSQATPLLHESVLVRGCLSYHRLPKLLTITARYKQFACLRSNRRPQGLIRVNHETRCTGKPSAGLRCGPIAKLLSKFCPNIYSYEKCISYCFAN